MRNLFSIILLSFASFLSAAEIQTPTALLGFEVGADRKLADYRQIRSYFQALDAGSERVQVVSLGKTTLGEDMIMAVISSEANMKNLPRIKEIARKLADPRGLSDREIAALVNEGTAVVLVTCNIHSTEIGSSQMAMEWAHALATSQDAETLRRLDASVLLLVPSLNPDGQIMETEWYRKYVGTKYEGGRMPWLYHPYVGHDNNRDWFMLTQKETRNMSRAIYHEWFPQVFVDEHQMGSTGPRMFIPPFSDPLDPDVHPLIMREINLIGTSMAFRLEQNEKAGVIHGYSFDAYLLGTTRNTGWWKNITGLLLEIASARMATPLYVDVTELRGGAKGLVEYKAQVNHPNPWMGGWWRLRDIMDYGRIASDALLEIVADRKPDLLRNMARRSREAATTTNPRDAYRIPGNQRDTPTARRLAQLMADHGVEVIRGTNGDFWIPLAQPYSKFVKEMFEPQRYPEVKAVAGKEILQPYDVVSWTLPLMMGVTVERAAMPAMFFQGERLPAAFGVEGPMILPEHQKAAFYALEHVSAESAKVVNAALAGKGSVWIGEKPAADLTQAPVPVELPPGTYYLDPAGAAAAADVSRRTGAALIPLLRLPDDLVKLRAPRVGLYKPWSASMDEGWTRFVLEQYGFDTKNVDNKAIRAGSLSTKFDAIILPDVEKDVIITGRTKREEGEMAYYVDLPPEYQGGLDKDGTKALRDFVEGGGTLIAFDSSTEYVMQEFNIPVRNALSKVKSEDFSSPGSLLRVNVSPGTPLTYGMPSQAAVFVDDGTVFETTVPAPDIERWILASYPDDGRDILLSGWIRGQERLARRAAAVAMKYGKGKIVLFGFRPQFRAQTHGTFPLVFNAVYWSVM